MAGWNGTGTFLPLYYFVQDSANGIKITSVRQDSQWALYAAGLMNCYTLDSETLPTAPLNMNAKKIQNVAVGSLGSDVAIRSDLPIVRKTAVAAIGSHNTESLTSGVSHTVCTNNGFACSANFDQSSEFSAATGLWTCTSAGYYLVTQQAMVSTNGVTYTGTVAISNPGTASNGAATNWFPAGLAGFLYSPTSLTTVINATVGQTIGLAIYLTYSAGTPAFVQSYLGILGPF